MPIWAEEAVGRAAGALDRQAHRLLLSFPVAQRVTGCDQGRIRCQLEVIAVEVGGLWVTCIRPSRNCRRC